MGCRLPPGVGLGVAGSSGPWLGFGFDHLEQCDHHEWHLTSTIAMIFHAKTQLEFEYSNAHASGSPEQLEMLNLIFKFSYTYFYYACFHYACTT